ncbi:MAG: hypothetical protein A2Y33_16385 [Spirochaetes bacterium GWF1_51_8]|nr:MAG: hypothetical protein A2Y33_16385 [Spirochaetes bacterium GWF1_51_8]
MPDRNQITHFNNLIRDFSNISKNKIGSESDNLALNESLGFEEKSLKDYEDLTIRDYKNDIDCRKRFSTYILWYLSIWTIQIFSAIGLKSFLSLSDGILIALISTTTINVIGLVAIVFKYYFTKNTKTYETKNDLDREKNP